MPRLNDADAAERAARRLLNGVEPGAFSEALARGLRIVEAFDHDHRRMTTADVARTAASPSWTARTR
ncbi:MAG: hypothetical protein LC635_04145 [Pseudonocardiaceae bacterium]|nr:hypothetical protein [Pseudonocardiaceae bacterium]